MKNGVTVSSKENKIQIQLIHRQVRGRTRFGVNVLKKNTELKFHLEAILPSQEGIFKVSANPATGSLLVFHREELEFDHLSSIIENGISTYSGYLNYTDSPSDCIPTLSTPVKSRIFFLLSGVFITAYLTDDVSLILELSKSIAKKVLLMSYEGNSEEGKVKKRLT